MEYPASIRTLVLHEIHYREAQIKLFVETLAFFREIGYTVFTIVKNYTFVSYLSSV